MSATIDETVMAALTRDPTQRWQTAAQLRDALNLAIAQPGNAVENQELGEWVRWVFTQEPGTEKSGISTLEQLTAPPIELDAFDIDTITAALELDEVILD